LTPRLVTREGDLKIIFDWYGRLNLYDIENGSYEQNDFSNSSPEQAQELFTKLKEWIK